jgi:large subunit ribosomal protein L28
MAQVCEICGKAPRMGNSVETRGKAKYLGGVGTKVTGITRRRFRPNLQRVKTTAGTGQTRAVRVCTQCLRSGAVRKAVKQAPFRVPGEQGTAKS